MEGKAECLGADSPGNSRCTLLRRVRMKKQLHDKPYRMRNVQSCWVAVGFLPPHGGQSYTHQSCTKVLELTWGAAKSSLGTRTVLLTQQICQCTGTWVCARLLWLPLRLHSSSGVFLLPLCPPFKGVHTGVSPREPVDLLQCSLWEYAKGRGEDGQWWQ